MYDYAYVAGVLDSDGSIFIQRFVRPNGRVRFTLKVTIAQYREDDMFEWLQQEYGGNYSRYETQNNIPSWTLCGASARIFLMCTAPHLHIKREQAYLALEFIENLPPAGLPMPEEVHALQSAIHERITWLNGMASRERLGGVCGV